MRWDYIHIDNRDVMIMSGWKLYISGNTLSQAKKASLLLYHIVKKYNLTTKVATSSILNYNKGRWGIMVIYLTEEAISNIDNIIGDITDSLRDYIHSGEIEGAHRINDKIYCRYDMKVPINPKIGVEYDKYTTLYRGEEGPYNIPNNKDVVTHKSPYNRP